jgi:hypothetical protein
MNDELIKVATEDEMSEWEMLSERQQEMAEDLAEIALKFGQFNQGTGADGAHYVDGSKNVFKSANIRCEDCIFFNEEASQCIIVEGDIDPDGICKLWVIPEEELSETPAQEEVEDATEKSLWIGMFDPRKVNKIG